MVLLIPPICLRETLTRQRVFWLLTIAAGVVTIVCFLFLRETYAPIILSYKVARLRKETNNPDLRSALAPENPLPPRALFMHSILRPLQMLTRSLIIFLMALYASVIYGLLYLLFTTFTFVFEGAYGFSSGTVGLTYLGIGVGMLFGLVFMGFTSDRVIKRAMQRGETLTPEHRLPLWLVVPPALLLPVGLLIYGWTTEYAESVHWIVPMLGTALFGFGMISLMVSGHRSFFFSVLGQKLTGCAVLQSDLSGGCVHYARCFGHGCVDAAEESVRSVFAACGVGYV